MIASFAGSASMCAKFERRGPLFSNLHMWGGLTGWIFAAVNDDFRLQDNFRVAGACLYGLVGTRLGWWLGDVFKKWSCKK